MLGHWAKIINKLQKTTDRLFQITDFNFLPFSTMYKLLRRGSLKVAEETVYEVFKDYVKNLIGHVKKNIFDKDQSRIVLQLVREIVNFSKMSLQTINKIIDENWLPKGM